jgi:hypothetical protein
VVSLLAGGPADSRYTPCFGMDELEECIDYYFDPSEGEAIFYYDIRPFVNLALDGDGRSSGSSHGTTGARDFG